MDRRYAKPHPTASEEEVLPTEQAEVELPPNHRLFEDLRKTFEWLERDEPTRGDLKILARAFKELRYAFKVFKPWRRQRKVTVFGSARTQAGDGDYDSAVEFGRLMADEKWYVLTGAGGGIMEAAHVGAGRDMSMGVNIMLPFEQSANPIIDGSDLLVNLRYFFTRKLLFIKEVHAIVCYPGGFGTQDEAFETLTLIQTGKRDLMPVVMVEKEGGTYWKEWREYVEGSLGKAGLISPADMSLLRIVRTPEDAVEEILRFYCVYNSMRYVRDKLVMRLHREPTDAYVEHLNETFGDILAGGRIESCGPDRLEADDEHLAHLPRLKLAFNRRDQGRLREMVDALNTDLGPDDSQWAAGPAVEVGDPAASPGLTAAGKDERSRNQ